MPKQSPPALKIPQNYLNILHTILWSKQQNEKKNVINQFKWIQYKNGKWRQQWSFSIHVKTEFITTENVIEFQISHFTTPKRDRTKMQRKQKKKNIKKHEKCFQLTKLLLFILLNALPFSKIYQILRLWVGNWLTDIERTNQVNKQTRRKKKKTQNHDDA